MADSQSSAGSGTPDSGEFKVPPPPQGTRSARHQGKPQPTEGQSEVRVEEQPPAPSYSAVSQPEQNGAQAGVGQPSSSKEATPTTWSQAHREAPPPPETFDDAVASGEGAEQVAAKKKRKWPKRVALSLVVAISAMIVIGGALFMWAYSKVSVPQPSEFALAQTTIVYYNDSETELGRFSEVNRTIIDVSELPSYVTEAVIASEDRTFYTNAGVDMKGIARALVNNLRGGARQGASTLSQQYVENYYLGNPTKTYADKMKEALIALKINRTQTKEEILDNYMNTIYFGRNTYGIEAAAEAYFGISATELTLSQAAMLSGIIPAPSAWDPAVDPEMAQQRWQRVLDLMVEEGMISQAEADEQVFPETLPQGSGPSTVLSGWSGYLLQQIRTELVATGSVTDEEIDSGGLRITSTIQQDMQEAAVDSVQVLPDDTPDSVQVALSSIDNATGEIVAEYAGDDYQVRQINSVTQETAMAGSVLKPFALIPYVEAGNSMYTLLDGNSPQQFGDLTVQNIDNYSYGYIDAIEATAVSSNTAFVQINEEIGPQTFQDAVISAGLPEDTVGLEPTLLNVLGFSAPRNIDITHAFATLANGGEKVTPHMVRSVSDANGNTVYLADTAKERVFSAETVSKIMPALEAVVDSEGSASQVADLDRPVGGKTGTSSDTKSAQFAGFVAQYTTSVSMFNVGDNNEALSLPAIGDVSEVHGGDWPADIWLAYMQRALFSTPVEQFTWIVESVQEQEPVVTEQPQSQQTTQTPATPTTPTTPTPTPEENEGENGEGEGGGDGGSGTNPDDSDTEEPDGGGQSGRSAEGT